MNKPNKPKQNGLTRRQFFKNSAYAAGGGLLLSSLPIGASAYGAGSDILKVGIIGCGGRGTGAANQVLQAEEGTKIVALGDAFRDRLDECYENLSHRWLEGGRLDVPEEHKFVGFDAFKHVTDMSDVVVLASAPGFHPKHFEYAIDQGKHVFMEKPVATDAPGIRRVLEAGRRAKEKNLNVVVGLQRRYQTSYHEVLKRVQNRELGKIISGQVYWNMGNLWVRDRQPQQNEMEYQMRNWYYFNWLCGDHILEQHIHNIDVANWFIGDYPVSAQGMGGREVRTGPRHGQIFDHHFVEFRYPDGQVISSQCRQQHNTLSRVDEEFLCTDGHIYVNGGSQGILTKWNGNSVYEHDSEGDPNPYQQEIDDLFESIRKGGLISDAEHGAKSTLAAMMGRMATYSGQLIEWEKALNSEKLLVPDDIDWDSVPPVVPDEDGEYPVPVPGVYDPFGRTV